jgi:protein TonB
MAIAALLYFAPALSKPHSDWVLAYLVDMRDGSSGRSTNAGAASIRARPSSHRAIHTSTRIGRTHPEFKPKAADGEAASLASRAHLISPPAAASHDAQSNSISSNVEASIGAGGSSVTGSGTVSGSTDGPGDGAGTSIAHADYGKNPPPIYPAIARRREQQGTVTLSVLVGIDGIVQRAEIAESSGFDVLDDAALETVRRRWRFTPARSAGIAIESWVLVPIRFALKEANEANASR